jgi:hypothetical protein
MHDIRLEKILEKGDRIIGTYTDSRSAGCLAYKNMVKRESRKTYRMQKLIRIPSSGGAMFNYEITVTPIRLPILLIPRKQSCGTSTRLN